MKQLYKKIGSYLILCIASVCFLLPFYLMICSASDGNISLSEEQIFGKISVTSCFTQSF